MFPLPRIVHANPFSSSDTTRIYFYTAVLYPKAGFFIHWFCVKLFINFEMAAYPSGTTHAFNRTDKNYLPQEVIEEVVQILIDRLIFIRSVEDRGI